MAAMSTALTELTAIGNSRTYYYSGHTAQKPKLVIQRKRVPVGNQKVAEDSCKVVVATTNAASEILGEKITMEAIIRRPIDGASGDVTAALATFRDVVAGDEFGTVVTAQNWLKA